MRSVVSVAIVALMGASQALGAQPPVDSTQKGLAPSRTTAPKPAPVGQATIHGSAATSANAPLANATVRLRDARLGRIVDTQIADKTGSFEFTAVDPGTYVVEILDSNLNVIAASQIVAVNAGEAVSAVVRLPFRISPFANVLGHSQASAGAVTSAAALAQVLSAVVTTATSPPSGSR